MRYKVKNKTSKFCAKLKINFNIAYFKSYSMLHSVYIKLYNLAIKNR